MSGDVSGSGLERSENMYLRDLLFSMASISTTIVSSWFWVMNAQCLLYCLFFQPYDLFPEATIPWCPLRNKVHGMFQDAGVSFSVSDRISCVAKLTEIICFGSDFLLTKRWNANKRVSTVRSLTTSK